MSWDKFYTQDLWLWLPLTEGNGNIAHDNSIWRITPFALHAATWVWGGTFGILNVMTLNFDAGLPSYLDCPALSTAKLDFTSGDFSMAVWAVIVGNTTMTIMCRGVANTDGWFLQKSNAGRLGFATCQAGFTQATYSTPCLVWPPSPAWNLVGVSRIGANVRTFVNGQDVTDAPDIHVDPTSANRELHIGILDDQVSDPLHGYLWNPRIWGRALNQLEWLELFNMERHWIGV